VRCAISVPTFLLPVGCAAEPRHCSEIRTNTLRMGWGRVADRPTEATVGVAIPVFPFHTTIVSVRSASDRLEPLRVDALAACSYRRGRDGENPRPQFVSVHFLRKYELTSISLRGARRWIPILPRRHRRRTRSRGGGPTPTWPGCASPISWTGFPSPKVGRAANCGRRSAPRSSAPGVRNNPAKPNRAGPP
jgi:hypothetical protein